MINLIVNFLVKSPLYPHWIKNVKMQKGNEAVLKGICGDVLEVGCGDSARKFVLLEKYKDIKKYIATDYSSWDDAFEKMNEKIKKWNNLGSIFFGYQKRAPIDKVCSATALSFEDATFDYHLSFEVLEHINDPEKYFSEAARVLKPGGYVIFSVPFLYRMHGGEPSYKFDYFRYLNGFFYEVAKKNNLEVVKIYSNTGYGTTMASLTNQWIIRRIMESNILTRILFLIFAPFIFILTNLLGLVIDIFPDNRFATRFHVILKKINKS